MVPLKEMRTVIGPVRFFMTIKISLKAMSPTSNEFEFYSALWRLQLSVCFRNLEVWRGTFLIDILGCE